MNTSLAICACLQRCCTRRLHERLTVVPKLVWVDDLGGCHAQQACRQHGRASSCECKAHRHAQPSRETLVLERPDKRVQHPCCTCRRDETAGSCPMQKKARARHVQRGCGAPSRSVTPHEYTSAARPSTYAGPSTRAVIIAGHIRPGVPLHSAHCLSFGAGHGCKLRPSCLPGHPDLLPTPPVWPCSQCARVRLST